MDAATAAIVKPFYLPLRSRRDYRLTGLATKPSGGEAVQLGRRVRHRYSGLQCAGTCTPAMNSSASGLKSGYLALPR